MNKEVFSTHKILQSLMLMLKDTRLRADPFVDFYSEVEKERVSKIYLQSILSQVAFPPKAGDKLCTMHGGWLQE